MKRRLLFALAASVCLALFLAAREAANWRPQVLGKVVGLSDFSFSPDGQILLDKTSRESTFLAADTGRLLRGLPPALVHVFSPDSRIIAVVNEARGKTPDRSQIGSAPLASFYDVRSGRLIRTLRAPQFFTDNEALDAAFSPDGKRFVIVSARSFYEFDAATGQLLHRAVPQTAFDSPSEHAIDYKISPDARRVVAFDKVARIYSIQSGAIVHSLRLPGFVAPFVVWSPDGALVLESEGGQLRVWNARTGKFIRQWISTGGTRIHFLPDSKRFAVATGKRLEVRDVLTGNIVQTLPGPLHEPFAIAPDGTFAVSVEKGKLLRWRLN